MEIVHGNAQSLDHSFHSNCISVFRIVCFMETLEQFTIFGLPGISVDMKATNATSVVHDEVYASSGDAMVTCT